MKSGYAPYTSMAKGSDGAIAEKIFHYHREDIAWDAAAACALPTDQDKRGKQWSYQVVVETVLPFVRYWKAALADGYEF